MNRYKMKPGTSIFDIVTFALKNKNDWQFSDGGTWLSDDSKYVMFTTLYGDISLDISFPKDLEKWNDSDHTLVMDEMFGQPFNLFYSYLKNPEDDFGPILNAVVEKYTEKMDSLPFLEKIAA